MQGLLFTSSWLFRIPSQASVTPPDEPGKANTYLPFDNIEYFLFDLTKNENSNLFDVQYQTTLIIFKGNQEVYRSIGEKTKDLIYEALKASI